MTEVVGMCEWCGLPILGTWKRTMHTTREVCREIMSARIEKLEGENTQLREQLQASNESLKMYVERPFSVRLSNELIEDCLLGDRMITDVGEEDARAGWKGVGPGAERST